MVDTGSRSTTPVPYTSPEQGLLPYGPHTPARRIRRPVDFRSPLPSSSSQGYEDLLPSISHSTPPPLPSLPMASSAALEAFRSPGPSLRIPTTHTLEDALQYWHHGNESKGLVIPIKRWTDLYLPSQYRSEAQKFTMVKHVVEEYEVECKGDAEEFERRFPGLQSQWTKLVKAVREARKGRGVSIARPKRIA